MSSLSPSHPIITHLHALLSKSPTPFHLPQLHAHLITTNALPTSSLHTQLITLYARSHLPLQSLLTFQSILHSSTIVTWTSLISHLPSHSLSLFSLLVSQFPHLRPNPFTLSAVLPNSAHLSYGRQIHNLSFRLGHHSDLFVATALLSMYSKFADVASSEKLFDEMPQRNLVSWNSLIVCYVKNKHYGNATRTFLHLLNNGSVGPDQVTISIVLNGCANSGELGLGRQIHARVLKTGLGSLAYVNNSLVDMYSKCRCFEAARKLFSESGGGRDVVTWNIMMMGLVHSSRFEEACSLFWEMRKDGILPDEASFSTVLHALANLASWGQGATVHAQIVKCGFTMNRCIGSSLITMYAKCGSLEDAYRTFEETKAHRNVVSWTAMIASFQQHGHGGKVIQLFDEMVEEGIEPDYITLVCVLSACSHNGLVDQGFRYFNSMKKVYKVEPGSEHYACMVDMLSRAGRLKEAKAFIDEMPVEPDVSVWGALLGACRNSGDLEMGREVAHKLFEIEPDNPGNYVLLSNMYVSHGRLEEAKEVRRLMGSNGLRKETSCSWIEVKNKNYAFTVHDQSHSKTVEIYAMLARLEETVKEKGYVADTRFAINDVGEYKEKGLWYHSERLALAFGLISLPVDAPIRIKKNLRTCGDCHTVMKLVSGIIGREIILRDTNRFHRFAEGSCSCGDYW